MNLLLVLLSIALVAAVIVAFRHASGKRAAVDRLTALQVQLDATSLELQKVTSELKSLSGLLPMCAWCKKIRDDAGYWQQLEGYLQSHTHVEFSHSMCPDCTQRIQADMPDAKWRI